MGQVSFKVTVAEGRNLISNESPYYSFHRYTSITLRFIPELKIHATSMPAAISAYSHPTTLTVVPVGRTSLWDLTCTPATVKYLVLIGNRYYSLHSFFKFNCFSGHTKSLRMAIAGMTHISFMNPRLLGKQEKTKISLSDHVENIECLTYDSISGHLIISDSGKRKIFRYNLKMKHMTVLVNSGIGKVTSMSFDSYGNNLYYCDEDKSRVEVLSLGTRYTFPVYRAAHGEVPHSIVVVPDHGVFFLAVKTANGTFVIKRANQDGTQVIPRMTGSHILGPKVVLSYDTKSEKVYWFDSGREIIEFISVSINTLAVQLPF